MEPLISIVTIFLNAKPFLGEAVSSVLAQTYTNWELLLVDDGSSDGSSELARSYAGQDVSRIRYLSHPDKANLGMSASRNLGLKKARGKYVIMLDADDSLAPQTLEKQVGILESHPEAGMAYGVTEWWYSWSGPTKDAPRDFTKSLGVPANQVIEPPFLLKKMLENEAHKPCGGMLRKDLVDQVGGYEEEFKGMYEDQVFLAKIALCTPIYVSSDCWYRYRKHAEACCQVSVREGTYRDARMRFLNWFEAYLEKAGENPELHKVIEQELWKLRYPRLSAWSRKARKWIHAIEPVKNSRPTRRIASAVAGQDFAPPVGKVKFGDLNRREPFSRKWGFERGQPVDRVYIETFLEQNAKDIKGRVLEIGDDSYSRRFGRDRISRQDVLSIKPGPGVTLVADLTAGSGLPSDVFDCVILTQTLQFIYDVRAAACHVHRMMKPGGVLLATVPGISPIPLRDGSPWGRQWYWLFTRASLERLFGEFFGRDRFTIQSHGNAKTATALLYGLAGADLQDEDFRHDDQDYQMILTVRAVKD